MPIPEASNIASTAYRIHIKVEDVQPGIMDRLVAAIERYLRGGAHRVIIARDQTFPAKFDLECMIRYTIPFQQRILKNHLRYRVIPPCFVEGKLEGRAVHVDIRPLENLDDSTFDRLRALWSEPPWKLEFEGHGSSVVRTSAPGLQFSLSLHSHSLSSPSMRGNLNVVMQSDARI